MDSKTIKEQVTDSKSEIGTEKIHERYSPRSSKDKLMEQMTINAFNISTIKDELHLFDNFLKNPDVMLKKLNSIDKMLSTTSKDIEKYLHDLDVLSQKMNLINEKMNFQRMNVYDQYTKPSSFSCCGFIFKSMIFMGSLAVVFVAIIVAIY